MKNTVHKKVVRLNQAPFASEVVERVLGKLKKGDVSELVIIARSRIPKEKQDEEGGKFTLDKYWFSENTSMPVLGLLEYMKNEVYEFIKGYIDEYED